ncbi:MAG: hypothetical protein AB1585_10680 [Thermodesulfobacteriota bacterium]
MEKISFEEFKGSVQGRKIQKQIRAAHEHIKQYLAYAGRIVDLGDQGAYLAVDDQGRLICRSYEGVRREGVKA